MEIQLIGNPLIAMEIGIMIHKDQKLKVYIHFHRHATAFSLKDYIYNITFFTVHVPFTRFTNLF